MGKSGKYDVRTVDLSLGGCYVDSVSPVEDGETMPLMLRLPDGRWVDSQGEVVYHNQGVGFGLRFTQMSEDAHRIIEQLIADAQKPDGH